ncbi:MAG TPA: DUF2188 domain-containing protein [Dongiaceae bacterium]|nr:DUF2188 domain-containing protein [Dongiaceae bacterium]
MPTPSQPHPDAFSGVQEPKRRESAADDALISPERTEHEQTLRMIEQPEQLPQPRTAMSEQPPPLLYDVVWHRGRWRIRHLSKHSAPFSDQAAAIDAAWKLARKKQDQGHVVEVRLHRTDGTVVMQQPPAESDQ